MSSTLLLSNDLAGGLRMATSRLATGQVTVVLLDRAAASARPGSSDAAAVTTAITAGVTVAAHDDALRRRGIQQVVDGIQVVDLDRVADLLTGGADQVAWL
ncbi:MAG: hypothetical protein M3415_03460 [Actinomycetota bacterium]|jgi:intracellular sulfur oxidation DsrE/DsrF family protein|nr:hypothetical protein [Actinomycetota bacterium]